MTSVPLYNDPPALLFNKRSAGTQKWSRFKMELIAVFWCDGSRGRIAGCRRDRRDNHKLPFGLRGKGTAVGTRDLNKANMLVSLCVLTRAFSFRLSSSRMFRRA